jgi:hypothetical protein
MSVSFELFVNLTPPPAITSITPTPATVTAFNAVRVHGTPPGEAPAVPPGAVNAVFDVIGSNFESAGGENQAEVIASIERGNLPAWITPGTMVVNVTSATTATVTVPLTVLSNRDSEPHQVVAGRTAALTISTDLANSTGAIETPLTVNQAGPIRLDPSTVVLRSSPLNLSQTVIVAGSGEISVTQASLDALNTLDSNVRNNLSFSITQNPEGPGSLTVTATRPAVDNILGTYTVEVTRDGIPRTLTLDLDITALDPPVVTWPTGFTATFGDLLSSVNVNDYPGPGIPSLPLAGGVGFAVFEGERVPGTFSWTNPTHSVGNAGSQTHSMTFTPEDTASFATVITLPGDYRSITVARATLTVTWPTGLTYTFGNTLPSGAITTGGGSAVSTITGETVPGTFTWAAPGTNVGNVGTRSFSMTFTPSVAANFVEATNNVYITVEKADQSPPGIPTAATDGITAVSITLNNITNSGINAQFIRSATATPPSSEAEWAGAVSFPNLTFTGLTPYTDYYFFARFPGDDNHNPSPPSSVGIIWTLKAALGGTPTISVSRNTESAGSPLTAGNVRYRDILTVNTDGLYADPPGNSQAGRDALAGLFTYQWYRDGAQILGATGASYELAADDIGEVITVSVATSNTLASVLSQPTVTVTKRQPVLQDIVDANDLTALLASQTFYFNVAAGTVTARPIDTPAPLPGMGLITVQYRPAATDNELAWTDTEPSNAGTYQIRVRIDEGDRYLATLCWACIQLIEPHRICHI